MAAARRKSAARGGAPSLPPPPPEFLKDVWSGITTFVLLPMQNTLLPMQNTLLPMQNTLLPICLQDASWTPPRRFQGAPRPILGPPWEPSWSTWGPKWSQYPSNFYDTFENQSTFPSKTLPGRIHAASRGSKNDF